jgi:hypothetical protein
MSVGVRELRVKGTNCTRARAIARVAARHNLASRGAVAAETIGGFKVTLRRPCSGCTPVWVASARRGKARVTFDLLGGAR